MQVEHFAIARSLLPTPRMLSGDRECGFENWKQCRSAVARRVRRGLHDQLEP